MWGLCPGISDGGIGHGRICVQAFLMFVSGMAGSVPRYFSAGMQSWKRGPATGLLC